MKNVTFFAILVLSACQHNSPNDATSSENKLENSVIQSEQKSKKEYNSESFISRIATQSNDSTHIFIKKATIHAQSKNVLLSVQQLEDSTLSVGGYIENSSMEQEILQQTTTPVSSDSLLTVKKMRWKNTLTLRVPEQQLYRFLKVVQQATDEIKDRKITAENVALDLWKEKRTQEIIQSHVASTDKNNVKVESTDLLNQKLQRLDAELNYKTLVEDVRFSLVKITLESPAELLLTTSPILKKVESYTPPFSERMSNAFQNGWSGFLTFMVGIAHLWILILIGIGVWILIIKMRNKKVN